MRNRILTIAFSIVTFFTYAQMDQGTKMIGGDFGFSFTGDKVKSGRTTTEGWRHASFNLNPNFGYFIIDHLAIGAKLNLASSSSTLKDGLYLTPTVRENDKYSTVSFSMGPWARYYLPIGEKSAVFGEANTGFGVSRYKEREVRNGKVVTDASPGRGVIQFGLGPGFSYFITENIGIEGLLQYRIDRSSYKPENSDNRVLNTNSGLFFNLGLQVYIP